MRFFIISAPPLILKIKSGICIDISGVKWYIQNSFKNGGARMNRKKDLHITEGPLFKGIMAYAIPIILGNLISIFFNAADIAILGNYADKNSVAAVGATGAIISLLVTSFMGISGGTNVILSRLIGAKDERNAKLCIDTSIVGSFVLGMALVAVCLALSKTFLVWTDCPEEIMHDADTYMKYYFLGIPAMMVYNFGATIIRASGDSRKPLYYLAASGALNVVLNFILCIVLDRKVIAVAVATLVSQILGAVLVMIHLVRAEGICTFSFKNITFSWGMLGRILKIGLPCAFNSSLFSISNLQIQSAINALGASCIAGNTVSGNVEGFVCAIYSAFSTTALVFVSQNYGAHNRERLNKSIILNTLVSFAVTITFGNLVYLFGESIFSIYIPGEAESIAFAMERGSYLLVGYWIAAVMGAFGAVIQAYGYSIYPMITSIVSVLGLRVVWMTFIYPIYPKYVSIVQCYIVSWSLTLIFNFIIFIRLHKKMLRSMTASESVTPENAN